MDSQGHLDLKVLQVYQETLVLRDSRVLLVPQGLTVTTDLQGL